MYVCTNMYYLRNKTSVPVFYRGSNIWVRVRVRMNEITRAQAQLI